MHTYTHAHMQTDSTECILRVTLIILMAVPHWWVRSETWPFFPLPAVSSRDALTWRQRLTIALDAARGLECLHAREIFHRDFRPETVFLDKV